MKKVLLVLMLAFSINLMGQQEYQREKVIQAPGKSITEIYKALKIWFVENAKSDSRNIIQIDNPTEGELMGKACVKIAFNNLTWNALTGTIAFIVDVKIKEGRFKVKFSQFSHQRDKMSLSATWDQGTVYDKVPENRQSGVKWKAYRTFSEKALPMLDTWCEDAFKSMENKVNSCVDEENDNW